MTEKTTGPDRAGTKPYMVKEIDGGPLGLHEVTGPGGYRSMHGGGGKDGGEGAAQHHAHELNRAYAQGLAAGGRNELLTTLQKVSQLAFRDRRAHPSDDYAVAYALIDHVRAVVAKAEGQAVPS